MNKHEQIANSRRLLDDDEFRISFITGLHEYQRANMLQYREGERRWGCGYDHFDDPPGKIYRHFIRFCEQQNMDWMTAHTIFRGKYGEFLCDCDYLYELKE